MKKRLLLLVALAAMVVPFLLSNQRTEAQATRQTLEAVNAAAAKLAPLEVVTVADYQRYLSELKLIETEKTPEQVKKALERYISTVEEFIRSREPDSEVDWVDPKLAEAQMEFFKAVNQFKGQAF